MRRFRRPDRLELRLGNVLPAVAGEIVTNQLSTGPKAPATDGVSSDLMIGVRASAPSTSISTHTCGGSSS